MKKNRLLYVDNIRLLVIISIVVHHLANTYSGFGYWYYTEPGQIEFIQTAVLGFYQAFVQGHTMGLLFLIAGYFIPVTYDKKGAGKFIKDKLFRLGIPTAIYMLIIHPLVNFILLGKRIGGANLLNALIEYITSFRFINCSGPLWFAFALLIFSLLYAVFRIFAPAVKESNKDIPTFTKILIFILLIGACSFLIRIVKPIDSPPILNMRLAHFAQYISFFIVGIISRRNSWFEKLDYKTGKAWLLWGILLGIVSYAAIMIAGGAFFSFAPYNGGLTWQNAAYSLWESFILLSMSVGLIAVFREKCNKQNKLIKTMSENAFSVYVFHTPIIIILTLLFAPLDLIPLAKTILLSLISIPVCFLSTNYTIQKVPLLRKIFR
jgi:fucose 4-O-acetylase-like acetyltransferase